MSGCRTSDNVISGHFPLHPLSSQVAPLHGNQYLDFLAKFLDFLGSRRKARPVSASYHGSCHRISPIFNGYNQVSYFVYFSLAQGIIVMLLISASSRYESPCVRKLLVSEVKNISSPLKLPLAIFLNIYIMISEIHVLSGSIHKFLLYTKRLLLCL